MQKLSAEHVLKTLNTQKNRDKSQILGRFFKTGPGQYGEGDFFLGINVPVLRKISKDYIGLSLEEVKTLINNKFHEARMVGLFILIANYQQTREEKEKTKIFKFYLANAKQINNWDLVDLSAPNIIGDFCVNHPENYAVLKKLTKSKNLWERRIAMVSSYAFIKNGSHREAFELAESLLQDAHDLIHKAVGWMLREAGKRVSKKSLEEFLEKNLKKMPRTALRYAIEHFEEKQRKEYLRK